MMDQTRSMIQMQHLLHAMRNATDSTSLTEIFRNIIIDARDFLMCENVQVFIVSHSKMFNFVNEEGGKVNSVSIHDTKTKSDEKIYIPIFT